MIAISANLGFLWTELPLPDAIRAAGAAGFDAVECHMPYDFAPADVREALDETGLEMISLNTRIGDQDGDFGVAALPGREELARRYIHEAIDYANAINCTKVSVLAGRSGRTLLAERTYVQNLAYAADHAAKYGITVLIEPLNTDVANDYHLVNIDKGIETIVTVGASNLKLMVDCFHTYKMDGELTAVFERALPHVGHVQFSSYPDRAEPDHGEIDYTALLPWLVDKGFAGPFGAEYNPVGDIDAGLSWLEYWKSNEEEKP